MQNFYEADVMDVIHIFFLLDNSGSMSGSSIQTLNEAMVNTMHELKLEADKREITAMIHVLSFNSSINWLCNTSAEEGVPVDSINWTDISATGSTNTAGAIRSILPGLSRRYIGHHAFRPIIVLITDGYSDDRSDTQKAIQDLILRQKTINVAVGVSGYNDVELNDFASEGTVVYKDGLGNEIETVDGTKFIFPVANAQDLARIIGDVGVSSMIASILLKNGDEAGDGKQSNDETPLVIAITKDSGETIPEPEADSGDWIK